MAYSSPNMGLRVWNLNSDPYDGDQLADNMARIDAHDHSPGRGHPIPTEAFIDGAITSAKLANTATVKAVGSFSAYRAAAYTAVANNTDLIFDTEEWDFSNWFDVGTGRFTPQVAGYYRVSAAATVSSDVGINTSVRLDIAKNAAAVKTGPNFVQPAANPSTTNFTVGVTGLVLCNGTTDFITIRNGGGVVLDFVAGQAGMYFQGELVGRS